MRGTLGPDPALGRRGPQKGSTMINGELIDLRAGDYQARVATCGATLVHLRHAGRDLILPFDAEARLPGGWQGKTLLPWPNRIKGSAYTYAGTTYRVACNEPDTGCALHGLVGWADFQVASDTVDGDDGDDGAAGELDGLVLQLSLPASYAYPWALEVEVGFALDARRGLTVTTTATNVGAATAAEDVVGAPEEAGVAVPAPYGVSCHPYLTRSVPLDECVLTVPAARVADNDPDTNTPVGERDVDGTDWDWRQGRLVATVATDNAYTGLPAGEWQVRLSGGESDRSVVMTARAPWVQIYSAEHLGRRGVAVEPMTCPPDAFNTGTDLFRLAVGQSHVFSYRLHEED